MLKEKKDGEMSELFMVMKNEMLQQMKNGNEDLDRKIADSSRNLEKNIKEDLKNIKKDVKQNSKNIEKINSRLESLEKKNSEQKETGEARLHSEILKQLGFPLQMRKVEKEHYVEKAKKIVGLFPVRENDINHLMDLYVERKTQSLRQN